MAYSMLGARGVLMVLLGCVGCDAAPNEEEADPAQQGLEQQQGGGYLVPVPIVTDAIVAADGGSGLTARPAPKPQGDAGQQPAADDAGQELPSSDAGLGPSPKPTQVVNPEPTDGLPACAATYFRDRDGDGFGDAKAKVSSCIRPAGYVENGDDCYDDNERAYPHAAGQFLQHRGDGSFDFDCDGKETQMRTDVAACPELLGCSGLGCDLKALAAAADKAANGGWSTSALPACGQQAAWGLSVSWFPGIARASCVVPDGIARTQPCR